MNEVRIREPFRGQGVMHFAIPDDALPSDHRARLLWTVLGTLDLSAFSSDAKSVQGHAGRPLASVRMLLTLWLYAISIGIGSAREIERRGRRVRDALRVAERDSNRLWSGTFRPRPLTQAGHTARSNGAMMSGNF